MAKVIGIDLGTTYSVMAYLDNGKAKIIPNAEKEHLTPSVVGFDALEHAFVGDLARRQSAIHPDRTVASIKRKMGTNHRVKIGSKEYSPQEISAFILKKLKRDAEKYLGDEVKQAVITVPAYFNDSQRQATKDAGKIAGLEVLRIINEPTAASLAYGLGHGGTQTVLVWDLGGGTFDVSILEIGEGVFEVKSTCGNTQLGGDDWTERIADFAIKEFESKHGAFPKDNLIAMQRVINAAEEVKIKISHAREVNINVPFISNNGDKPEHLDCNLSREVYEDFTADLLEKLIGPTRRALEDAGLTPEKINHAVLVGGSTRMPAVQAKVAELMSKQPFKGVNPDEVVAIGAAIQAGVLTGEVTDVVLVDVVPLSLGIETLGGIFAKIMSRNTTVPTSKSQIFTTSADNQIEVDIHILQGERELVANNTSLGNFKLVDVSPEARGVPKIEVTFDVDADGILSVSAKDLYTENEQRIQISSPTALSSEEVEQMVTEAKSHAEDDRKKREEIELTIKADNVVYAALETMEEKGDLFDKVELKQANTLVNKIKAALKENNCEPLPSLMEELRVLMETVCNKKTKEKV